MHATNNSLCPSKSGHGGHMGLTINAWTRPPMMPTRRTFRLFGMGRVVALPGERGIHVRCRAPRFADDDDPVELLALGLVKVHYLQARRSFDAIKNFLLREGLVQGQSSAVPSPSVVLQVSPRGRRRQLG